MKPCTSGHAHWFTHVNGVGPSLEMRDWLTDRVSLTAKLTARCCEFRVRRLRQGRAMCLADEFVVAGLPRRCQVQEREVLLQCDGIAVVYAHTIVPLNATASDWPFFNTLGERSLGTTLFGDPRVARGTLEFARLHPMHPLARRTHGVAGGSKMKPPLLARRCLYRRKSGVLLVTEVFLPTVTALRAPVAT